MDWAQDVALLDAKAKSSEPKAALVHTPPKPEVDLQEVELGSDRFDVCGVWGYSYESNGLGFELNGHR